MLKTIYLKIVAMISLQAKKKQVEEVVYLLDFPQKNTATLSALVDYFGERLVICYSSRATEDAMLFKEKVGQIYCLSSKVSLFTKVIPLLSRTKIVFADNYFPFLGGVSFRKDTRVIQLWHAVGAMKAFGWDSPETHLRSATDKERFLSVYHRFTDFIVGSRKMGSIFQSAWQTDATKIRLLGNVNCDKYFQEDFQENAKQKFAEMFPGTSQKNVFLYAPTFRRGGFETFPLDLHKMNQLLEEQNSVLFLKLHPLDAQLLANLPEFENIQKDLRGLSLEEMLVVSDVLISDYSSIPFEYTLANPIGTVHFYCPDLKDYEKTVGLVEGFRANLPGELHETQSELMNAIQAQEKNDHSFEQFNALWNERNDGHALERFADFVKEIDGEK